MASEEMVLSIDKKNLPPDWTGPATIVPMHRETFCSTCTRAGFSFVPRSRAETDPTGKQIIPYIVIQSGSGRDTAVYLRRGSEQRLHDLWSVGIGGHINPEDEGGQAGSFEHALMSGMQRELDEELVKRPLSDIPEFIGIIGEEDTDVGKVHLGAVFRILTNSADKYEPGPELVRFQWESTGRLDRRNLERWSSLALKLLGLRDRRI